MQPTISPATRAQLLSVCLLNLATFPPESGGLRLPGSALARTWWSMQQRHSQNSISVATSAGEVVGSVEVHTAAYLRSRAPELTPAQAAQLQPELVSLAVREEMRGSGIGRRLVEAAIAEASAGAGPGECMLLRVEAANAVALRLYSSCGFAVVSAPGCQIQLMRRRLGQRDERPVAVAVAAVPPAAPERASWLDPVAPAAGEQPRRAEQE